MPGRRANDESTAQLLERFEERVCDYGATAQRVPAADLAEMVAWTCAQLGVQSLAVPPELSDAWRPSGVALHEDHALCTADLDQIDGALTGCAVAIAQTGTLVLDGQSVSDRRALTVVPAHHICVVGADQVTGGLPEALARVAPAAAHGWPIAFVSGPSAGFDIELGRGHGRPGPRHLVVLTVLN